MRSNKSEWYLGRHWLWLFGLQILPIVAMIIAANVLGALARAKRGDPFLIYLALGLAVAGLLLLFLAKLPLYRQGKFFTLGSKALPENSRSLYRIAYAPIGLSVVILLVLLAALR
jgi:hypothetical protein